MRASDLVFSCCFSQVVSGRGGLTYPVRSSSPRRRSTSRPPSSSSWNPTTTLRTTAMDAGMGGTEAATVIIAGVDGGGRLLRPRSSSQMGGFTFGCRTRSTHCASHLVATNLDACRTQPFDRPGCRRVRSVRLCTRLGKRQRQGHSGATPASTLAALIVLSPWGDGTPRG
jgi:hypothetical protein